MPVTFAWRYNGGVADFEIKYTGALDLQTYPSVDHEEPLRTGVLVPIGSSAVREGHFVDAKRSVGFVMGQALDGQAAERGCRIAGAGHCLT